MNAGGKVQYEADARKASKTVISTCVETIRVTLISLTSTKSKVCLGVRLVHKVSTEAKLTHERSSRRVGPES